MNDKDIKFCETFNEYYPYAYYILKNPKPITTRYDDLVLTEIFIPGTDIKPVYVNGVYKYTTEINADEVFVKVNGSASEMRIAYYDFNDDVRENIRIAVKEDMNVDVWEFLYIEYETDLYLQKQTSDMLKVQKQMITDKYGECPIKSNFKIESTISLIK